jgi:hypothetical protein
MIEINIYFTGLCHFGIYSLKLLVPQRQRISLFSFCVQIGSEAHPASYRMGTGVPFPEGKARQGRAADHSLPSSAEVRNE